MASKISVQLAEKMIRLEQTNAISFSNKRMSYSQTDYFKRMSSEDKARFEGHLIRQERLPFAFGVSIILPLLLFSLTKITFTGNAIAENLDSGTLGALGIFFISMFFGAFALFIYHFIARKRLERNFLKSSGIMDNMIINKSVVRRY